MTAYHGYNTPEKGERDWHVPLNENFEAIDRDVEIRDAESNLADYEPKAGAKFFATDTGAVYLGDGNDWSEAPRQATRTVEVQGETVRVGGRNIVGSVDMGAIENSDAIDLQEGDVYLQVE